MKEWIWTLAASEASVLGSVRGVAGLHAALEGETIWLRGVAIGESIPMALRQLPVRQTYMLDEGYLFPEGKLTPVARLNTDLPWQPLPVFLPVSFPVSLMPVHLNGTTAHPYPVRLRPSAQHREGYALLTDLHTWHSYATTAPQVRLEKLIFAVAEDNQVLILGVPLLPIPGQEYWLLKRNLLIPSGFDFDPPILGDWLADQLEKDALVLFDTHSRWEKIPAHCFVPATRSAVRLTYERRMAHG